MKEHRVMGIASSRAFSGLLGFQRLPQLTNACPMEDFALSFPVIPGFVAVSCRHVALLSILPG
jgi:hypothetical protein